jgi:AcrR family transcriptional regulator
MDSTIPLRRRAPGSSRAPERGGAHDTRERILDVAESLFAETGFTATSLRTITSRAGVNLAAVNYHFGSKEALVEAVFSRRLAPLNRQRIEALGALESAAGGRPLALRDILRAFVDSAFHRPDDEAANWVIFLRLLGRAFTEPTEVVRSVLQRQYRDMAQRYKSALARSLPDLPETELAWRMQFMFGTVSYVMAGGDTLECVGSCRLDDLHDLDIVAERLVGFLEAGLSAPAPTRNAPKRVRPRDSSADVTRSPP